MMLPGVSLGLPAIPTCSNLYGFKDRSAACVSETFSTLHRTTVALVSPDRGPV